MIGSISVFVFLVILALVLTLVNAVSGKVPLWIPVLLIAIALLIGRVPALR